MLFNSVTPILPLTSHMFVFTGTDPVATNGLRSVLTPGILGSLGQPHVLLVGKGSCLNGKRLKNTMNLRGLINL